MASSGALKSESSSCNSVNSKERQHNPPESNCHASYSSRSRCGGVCCSLVHDGYELGSTYIPHIGLGQDGEQHSNFINDNIADEHCNWSSGNTNGAQLWAAAGLESGIRSSSVITDLQDAYGSCKIKGVLRCTCGERNRRASADDVDAHANKILPGHHDTIDDAYDCRSSGGRAFVDLCQDKHISVASHTVQLWHPRPEAQAIRVGVLEESRRSTNSTSTSCRLASEMEMETAVKQQPHAYGTSTTALLGCCKAEASAGAIESYGESQLEVAAAAAAIDAAEGVVGSTEALRSRWRASGSGFLWSGKESLYWRSAMRPIRFDCDVILGMEGMDEEQVNINQEDCCCGVSSINCNTGIFDETNAVRKWRKRRGEGGLQWRLSRDPQTVAARRRRERVSERVRLLRRLLGPWASKLHTAAMLHEAASYLAFLRHHLQQQLAIAAAAPLPSASTT